MTGFQAALEADFPFITHATESPLDHCFDWQSHEAVMRISSLLSFVAILSTAPFAVAGASDRPVTDQERTKLSEAVKATGCSGGKMEFDDDKGVSHPKGKFEVDDAICGDGKKYDLAFDTEFKLLTKKPD